MLSHQVKNEIDRALEPLVESFARHIATMHEHGASEAEIEALLESAIVATPGLDPQATAYALAKFRAAIADLLPRVLN